MHSNGLFLKDVAGFLGSYYTSLAIMNAVAALILWQKKKQVGWAVVWSAVAAFIAFKAADLIVGLRVPEDVEREGLDTNEHNERAYTH